MAHNLKTRVELYNLGDLFEHYKFPTTERNSYSQSVFHGENANTDPIAWIQKLVEEQFSLLLPINTTLRYEADLECKAFVSTLVSFLFSIHNRPDGAVYLRKDGEDPFDVPLLLLEIHSSPYKNSVSQTAVDVLDQLRLLRCLNPEVTHCVGFTFPKYATSTDEFKTCVTKVSVSFTCVKKMMFQVTFEPLKMENVQSEIEKAFTNVLGYLSSAEKPMKKYFMRLSCKELAEVSCALQVDGEFTQIPTPHSLLFQSEEYVWKYLPNSLDREYLTSFCIEGHHMNYTAVPSFVVALHSAFFRNKRFLSPLSSDQVTQCLEDFVRNTAIAIKELHDHGVAHLDIRLPNICFVNEKSKFRVMLIDLDRSRPSEHIEANVYIGEMYEKVKEDWCYAQLDWKQFGLLIARIVYPDTEDEEIVSKRLFENYPFMCELVERGNWEESLFAASELFQTVGQNKPLADVLKSRLIN